MLQHLHSFPDSWLINGVLAVALNAQDEKAKEGIERQLVRLIQHGLLAVSTVEPLIKAIQLQPGRDSKEDKQAVRVGFYLLQLAFGDGSAGTPLPVSSPKGTQWGVHVAGCVLAPVVLLV
jgi:hypothetical protein